MSEEILKVLEKLKDKNNYQRDCNDGSYFIELFANEIYILCEFIEDMEQKVEQLEKENKILKENAEHNDKVVDKVNWENMLLKRKNKEIDRLNNIIKQIEELCDKHELGKYDYSVPVFELKEVIKSEYRKHNK